MYLAPLSRRALPALGPIGENRGPWMAEVKPGSLGNGQALPADAKTALANHAERLRAQAMAASGQQPRGSLPAAPSTAGSARSVAASDVSDVLISRAAASRLERRGRRQIAAAPWESMAVQELASRLNPGQVVDGAPAASAMMLQGRSGTVLQAIGDPEDHKVAGKLVAGLANQLKDRNPGSSRPSTALVDGGASASEALQAQRGRVAFGAVYEHRDAMGKPRLIGSTNVLPERQFQLDWQDNAAVKSMASREGAPGSSGRVVWVGIGAGPVGEKEMTRVREAIVDARADRLKVDKLASEKPYSRHF